MLQMDGDEEGHGSAVQVLRTMYELVWCGGANEGQDVTIRLVPHGLSRNGSKETLQLLKVHSSHLRRCSKYFETCLSERWSAALSDADACCDVELALEVHGDLACYRDCFSQMYSSCWKEIRSVEYSLALLKVASQIEYRALMDSIVRYLSAITWSDEDEIMIREYSSSPDFPRNCAEDLVVRLGLDEVEEDTRKNMHGTIENCLRNALSSLSPSSSDFIESLLEGIESDMSSSFAKTVISIIIKIAKEKFEKLSLKAHLEFTRLDVRGMNWILTVLLNAGVAEELVECFVHIKSIPEVLISDDFMYDGNCYSEGISTGKVIIRICEEVTSGRLPLRTAERVALFRNWLDFFMIYSQSEYDEVIRNLFSTLPCKVQIEYVNGDIDFIVFMDPSSLAKLVKKTLTSSEGTRSRPSLEGPSRQQQGRRGEGEGEERRPTGNDETGLRTVKKQKRRRS